MKKLLVIVGIILLAVAGYYLYLMMYPKPMPKMAVESYTLEQLSTHNDKSSCWLAIDGKVYDVTPFVASGFHPGKEAILQGCGKDATTLFNTRPMGTGTPHSERARNMLPKYLIGDLAQ